MNTTKGTAMSDTPRTDAAIRDFGYRDENGTWNTQMAVDIDFARQLERENAELVDALRAWLPENPADDGTQDAAMRALLAKLGEA